MPLISYRVEIISQKFDEMTESKGSLESCPKSPSSNVDRRLSEIEKQVSRLCELIQIL